MLKTTICKEFSFDAAHQLPNHAGKCRNLHGHTYKVQVYVIGYTQPVDGSSNEGMVADFSVIKEAWKTYIEPRCDHRFLNDTLPIPITTAEHIAHWMLIELQARTNLPLGTRISKVRVYETPTCFAEVEE